MLKDYLICSMIQVFVNLQTVINMKLLQESDRESEKNGKNKKASELKVESFPLIIELTTEIIYQPSRYLLVTAFRDTLYPHSDIKAVSTSVGMVTRCRDRMELLES